MQCFRTGKRRYDDRSLRGDFFDRSAALAGAARGNDVIAVNREAGARQVRGHRRAHDAQADHADRSFHFFFFVFLEGVFFFEPSGFASTSTAATMHGSPPRTLQEWFVPRCTRMSPARSSVSPFSMTAWISPFSTMMRSEEHTSELQSHLN